MIELDNSRPWHWSPADRIAYYAHVFATLTAQDRAAELISGDPNAFRIAHGYYGDTRLAQSVTDADFARLLPEEYGQVASALPTIGERWETAAKVHQAVESCLTEAGIGGYVADHRAKSTFSIWRNMQRKNLDVDEVFDLYGVRIVAGNMLQAIAIIGSLQQEFSLMAPHVFRHRPGDVHQPQRGSLSEANSRGYRSFRMNLVHDRAIFEAQVLTVQAFAEQYQHVLESSEYPGSPDWEQADDYKGASRGQDRR